MPSLSMVDIERAYYAAVLGVPVETYQSVTDLRNAFFAAGPGGGGGGSTDPEVVRDTIAAALIPGTGVTLDIDDVNNTITINSTGGGGVDAETVRDTIGTALVPGTNITVTVNDAGDTITIGTTATVNATDAQLRDRTTHTGVQTSASISDFTEAVQDALATFFNVTGATFTYDDVNNQMVVTVPPDTNTTDPEAVRDAIGAAMVGVGVISVTVNDAADTITISSVATQNSTDAALRDRSTHTGTEPISALPAKSVLYETGTTRPTARTDIMVLFIGADPGANALDGDRWFTT